MMFVSTWGFINVLKLTFAPSVSLFKSAFTWFVETCSIPPPLEYIFSPLFSGAVAMNESERT